MHYKSRSEEHAVQGGSWGLGRGAEGEALPGQALPAAPKQPQ